MVAFFTRILRVFLLSSDEFEEIGEDKNAIWTALIIVTVVAFIAAVSKYINFWIYKAGFTVANMAMNASEVVVGDYSWRLPSSISPWDAAVSSFAGAYVQWILWALITWLIGDYLFGGDAGWGKMLRILGWAQLPGVIAILGFFPGFGLVTTLIVWVWTVIAGFVGVKAGTKLSNGRTILTIVVSMVALYFTRQWIVQPLVSQFFQ
jgi:hypothetical protein